ncbi:MAG: sugar ABC transporter ATP-binding protein [Verrucomicrobia bacterium]|nr:sugar ABC transporter ATP-binding protein [Verrucomicrobiota bacterium]
MSDVLLHARGLTKHYGGIQALDNVEFEVRAGEIHALCGENGAGKSTLVKILAGLVAPDHGEVTVDSTPLRLGRRTDPRLISVVYQELSVIPHLSVLDNVMLGSSEIDEIYWRSKFLPAVQDHLKALGLGHVDPNAKANELSLAERQLVEIARGVARGARVLLLDEPTATLSDNEIERVFSAARWLCQHGTGIVFISHRLEEVFALSHRVTVMRNGRKVLTKATPELTSTELVHAMIGRDIPDSQSEVNPVTPAGSIPKIVLRQLSVQGCFNNVSLEIQSGEITAMVGQLGSGADLLVETLAGLQKRYEGEILIDGTLAKLGSVREAMHSGIAYVSEDRAAKGVFLEASVRRNLTASILKSVSRFGLILQRQESVRAETLAKGFEIDVRRLPDNTAQLSGGNQQKVSLAKATATQPKLLLLNEPTRGIDVGARSGIYRRLKELAGQGLTIIFYSTDLEEVTHLADRVVNFFRGNIVTVKRTRRTSAREILYEILHGQTLPNGEAN